MADQERRDATHSGAHDDGHDDDSMQRCIEECINCHAVCTMTAQHCLVAGGDHADVNIVGVLLDCAELCQVSANFMLRGSPFHGLTCAACAELCRACEEVCRSVGGDEQLDHCASVCAACAEACDAAADGDRGPDDDDD